MSQIEISHCSKKNKKKTATMEIEFFFHCVVWIKKKKEIELNR